MTVQIYNLTLFWGYGLGPFSILGTYLGQIFGVLD